MLRHTLLFVLVGLLVGTIEAAPRPRGRMVMKIRPTGRSLDRPVAGPLNYVHVSVDDPEVVTMGSFAATALSFANINSSVPLELVRITSASRRTDSTVQIDYKITLVLNGLGHYYYCNAAVVERVTNMTKDSSHREVHLTQPSSCIEAPQEVILAQEDGILPAALYAASELTKTVLVLHTSPVLRNVSQWHDIEKHVGNEYKLNLVFANSENGQLNCLAEVNERITQNDKQIVRLDCSPSATAEAPTGEVLPHPAEVDVMAEFVADFLKESRKLDVSLLRVTSAQRTPYEGVQLKPSVTLSTRVENEDVFYYCNAAVFQDTKTHDYELVRSQTTCSNSPPAAPADPVPVEMVELKQLGAYEVVPVDDAQVKQMATFATAALTNTMNSGSGNLILVRIESAQRQVVAGTNHKLSLDLETSTGESLHCMVVIFDQPWTNTRELSEAMCRPGAVRIQSEESNDDRDDD